MLELVIVKSEQQSVFGKVGAVAGKALGTLRSLVVHPQITLGMGLRKVKNFGQGFEFGYMEMCEEVDKRADAARRHAEEQKSDSEEPLGAR